MRKNGAGDGKVIGSPINPRDPNWRSMPPHVRDAKIKEAEEKRNKAVEKETEKEKK